MTRRLLWLALVLVLPAVAFVAAWQGTRFEGLAREIRALEADQERILDENKKLIASIAVFRSPRRIVGLATTELGLEPLDPALLTRFRLGSEQ